MLSGLGPSEGQEAFSLGSWYQGLQELLESWVLESLSLSRGALEWMKSQRSVNRRAEETVHRSTQEDQVKGGHFVEGPLRCLPCGGSQFLFGSPRTSGIAMGSGLESPNYRRLERGICQI